jgi:ribosome-associated translation inhibitor RaiA
MQTPIQITYRGLPHSDAVEQSIQRRALHIERIHPGITACHVTVELPHQDQHQGNHYRVQVDVRVPGGRVAVTRGDTVNPAYENVYAVIRDAFNAARRRLDERHERPLTRRRPA